MNEYVSEKNGVFPSVCSLDCPDQCGLLITKEDGKIVKVQGDPDHPVTKGNICNKVRHMTERIYDPKRLSFPLKRVGAKGEGNFERISWDEAIETIRMRWSKLIDESGPESILPYSFYGNMGKLNSEGMDRRFFHRLGASLLDRTICSDAGSTGYKYTMGGGFGTDPEETINTKLFIFWGVNAVSTNMHQVAIAEKARKNGAKIVVIDVHKNQTGRWADWFISILPGTDAALALGLMHILFAEELTDNDFLERYTVGHKQLKEHVKQYDPKTVSALTGVPIENIYKLARMYGETSPSFIRIGNGMQHHDNGGMCVRTVACLPALVGQWRIKGGGAIKSNSSILNHNSEALERLDLLEKKDTRIINMNVIGQALLDKDQPIRSLFIYNCNPAIVAPEGNKVRVGLAREDLFTVVHDLFLTETAMYADLVLPATSSYENTDFYTSYWHHFVQIQQPVIEAYGESKSNTDVFRLLAQSFGFEEECFKDSDVEMIHQGLNCNNPHLLGIDYKSLSEKQYIKAKRKSILEERLPTPSGKIELYSEALTIQGFPALPSYMPLVKESEHPFLFIPAPNHNFLNSTFSNNEKHVRLEKVARVHLNETDAFKLGIENGDKVRIWNERGECELLAAVGQNVLPGVVVTQGLWADALGTKYFVNALTPDRIADMGGGATFFSGRVSVEKLSQN
ncbi:oxidoreductase [Anaerobacillus alkalilacustris]|uniref:Oxidoreductase n=1 Tax=Anaerobacillus alkalilacustris TaxID=393763 RepID=A0A1S2LWV3_9BACI|nr:molybdopterin oxidoreductase family protein [Anaerobacillus alkalilacustris]OIJ16816.1 oxidoreductase [Anaerobacillus alkalilacustris]